MSFQPFSLTIATVAVAKARPRFGRKKIFSEAKTSHFEADLRWNWIHSQRQILPEVATKLTVTCFLPRPKKTKNNSEIPIVRPDLDNYAKAILDGLNSFAWRDDAQVSDLVIVKRYTREMPKIVLYFEPATLEGAR